LCLSALAARQWWEERREAKVLGGSVMGTVARVTEISSTSEKSFEDAIAVGIARADETLRKIRAAWVKEQEVRVVDGTIVEYQVNLLVTFVLDDV
jgi:flavin-binding protein dodecin